MSQHIDISKLSAMIKSKRGNMGLRAAAKEIGHISASTLSRIEQGNLPDLDSFMAICDWLKVSPDEVKLTQKQNVSTHDKIVAHLRADRTLSANTQSYLIEVINLAYEDRKKR